MPYYYLSTISTLDSPPGLDLGLFSLAGEVEQEREFIDSVRGVDLVGVDGMPGACQVEAHLAWDLVHVEVPRDAAHFSRHRWPCFSIQLVQLNFAFVGRRLRIAPRNFDGTFFHRFDRTLTVVRLERVLVAVAVEHHGRERVHVLRLAGLLVLTLGAVDPTNVDWASLAQFLAESREDWFQALAPDAPGGVKVNEDQLARLAVRLDEVDHPRLFVQLLHVPILFETRVREDALILVLLHLEHTGFVLVPVDVLLFVDISKDLYV